VYGTRGNDRLLGQVGRDAMYGGSGSDSLVGGTRNANLIARDRTRERADGGAGIDGACVDRRLDRLERIERLGVRAALDSGDR
jgi:Ca2+-binding RTX toxin-like protein